MHSIICTATAIAILGTSIDAFTPIAQTNTPITRATNSFATLIPAHQRHSNTQLYAAADDDAQDNEIERLKRQAAKLRAEAASLEADKAKQLADAAEKAFNKFDINSDGEVSLSELKLGLEKELKVRVLSYMHIMCLFPPCDRNSLLSCHIHNMLTVFLLTNSFYRLKFPKRE